MEIISFDQTLHFSQLLTWFQDTEVMRGMAMDVMSAEELKLWINDDKIILIATEDDEFVGMLNFYHYKTQLPQIEVGYLIDPNHQGKGLATELLSQGIVFLKENYPEILEISETYVEDFNSASRRVLEKNGFEMYLQRPEKQRSYYKFSLK